jgi:predicted dehydrogenase
MTQALAPIRWGILSTGGIATRFVEDLRLLPDATVVAVGSRAPATAKAFADRYGIPRGHGSWAELVEDHEVDVVYVATPHSAHYEAASMCLAAGKAVLCEKPFTLDLPSSQDLVATAEKRGLFLMEAMWTRCNPAILRMSELVRDGAIGEITTVQADFGLAGPFAATHRLRAKELGGGALLDLGVYPITIAHLLLGLPDHVQSLATLSPEGIDENTGIVFGYESGAIASLTCGIVGATPTTAVITGTRGRIELPAPFFCAQGFVLHRAGSEPQYVERSFPGTGYQFEAAEVQRCVRAGLTESPLVPHAVTLEVMALLDTIRAQIGVDYT